jgi:hypothetical protein
VLFVMDQMAQHKIGTTLNACSHVFLYNMLVLRNCVTCGEGQQLPQQQCACGGVTGPVRQECIALAQRTAGA